MIRSVGTALVGTVLLAVLAGCAQQESFGLPELTPQRSAPGVQVYPGLGYGFGYGYGNGYPNLYQPGYGYPNGYQPGYGFTDPIYAGQGPYPYTYNRYPYNPYPRYVVVACPDNDRNGRCDRPPPKDREHRGNGGRDRDHEGAPDRDDRPVPPRYARGAVPDAGSNAGPRARRDVAPVVPPQSEPAPAPAPVAKQPARTRSDPRRETAPVQEP